MDGRSSSARPVFSPSFSARSSIHGRHRELGANVMWAGDWRRPYDYGDPDHYRLPFDTPEIPYVWSGTGSARLRADAKRG